MDVVIMKKETLYLILLILLLIIGMTYTLLTGGSKSRHGYGQSTGASSHVASCYGSPCKTGYPFFPQA